MLHDGAKVMKSKGYHYVGTIVGECEKLDGQKRYLVEFAGLGMLHVFGSELIEISEQDFKLAEKPMNELCSLLDQLRLEYTERLNECHNQ